MAAVVVGTLVLAFSLPYYWPPGTRLVSPSYVFGFNNKIAIACVLAGLGVITLLKAAWRTDARPAPISWDFSARAPRALHLFAGMAAWYLVVTAAIYFLIARPDGYYKLDWESSHFIWRLKLMDIYSLQPYADFKSEYGPALVYLPFWTFRFLRPLHVTHEASYYALHFVLNLLGLFCIYIFISHAQAPLRWKSAAFVLLGLSAFAPRWA